MLSKYLSKVYNSSPQELGRAIAYKLHRSSEASFDQSKYESIEKTLGERFDYYKTGNLKGITAQEFRSYIQSRIDSIDPSSEGYAEEEVDRQRDFSVKFHWGHNHDFGDFQLAGPMGNRHIQLLASFCTLFPISLEDLRDKDVFDVGCWTGGTTLLLAALGSRVLAIEEVNKYAEMVSFLAQSFGIQEQVKVVSSSLYSCDTQAFYDRFDIVYFPGVIYHLSDPLIGLRILYNACRLNGVILVESAGINREEPLCRFDGSYVCHSGEKKRLDRSGWNWFIPSPSALYRMLREAGFDEIQTLYFAGTGRVYGYAKKTSQVAICRAGLSVPDIR
jgi:SAM-dependent methyltransferase